MGSAGNPTDRLVKDARCRSLTLALYTLYFIYIYIYLYRFKGSQRLLHLVTNLLYNGDQVSRWAVWQVTSGDDIHHADLSTSQYQTTITILCLST